MPRTKGKRSLLYTQSLAGLACAGAIPSLIWEFTVFDTCTKTPVVPPSIPGLCVPASGGPASGGCAYARSVPDGESRRRAGGPDHDGGSLLRRRAAYRVS